MTDTTTVVAGDSTESADGHKQHLGWALVLISVAQLMVVLDSTIANIALPFIQKDLDISASNLQWVVTGYALAFGGLLLLGGRLGDLYGRRRIFTYGVAIFAVASGLGGVAQNELMLLGSRGLQGLGAALAAPTALALITTNFPAGPPRNRAFSVYAAMSGVGAAIGLVLGGWLTGLHPDLLGMDVDGWRLTFLINVPIGIAAALAAPRILAESETHPGELDLPGAVSATLGLISLVYGITRAGDQRYGWDDGWTIAFLLVGVALLTIFVAIERRVEHPLLPLRILLNRTRATAFVAMMIVPAAMFAMFYFLSQFVQNVMGYSPLHTGFAFLPFSVGIVFGATLASKLATKVDPRWVAGTGTALAGVALLMFSRLSVDDSPAHILDVAKAGGHLGTSVSYWADLFPYIVMMAVGMGLTFAPMFLAAVHRVDHRDSGVGSGVLNTMQQVGGALGLATLSTVAVSSINDKVASLFGALGPDAASPTVKQVIAAQAGFTDGATQAFLVGAFMIWTASLIVWIFLNVKHEEMATDEAPEGAHVG
ncbi:MAG: MFS transporter [Nocardioidaceae bacterium]|nr:MFS transporter [Nocardioidaceae bacterium]